MTTRAKHIGVVFGILFAAVLVAAGVGGYMLSRDVAFDFNPDLNQANDFRRKLRNYEKARTNDHKGFMRFTQAEINSYISRTLTNVVETNGMLLHRFAVELGPTNLIAYSWGESRRILPLKFVVQREFSIRQEGTNVWELPLTAMKIGEVEIPENWWPKVTEILAPLDAPLRERYPWATNVPAVLVRKNEVSAKPELRLYTYKPIPDEDRR